jgi:hypothetical protein
MEIANTMNVCGLERASRTIHISFKRNSYVLASVLIVYTHYLYYVYLTHLWMLHSFKEQVKQMAATKVDPKTIVCKLGVTIDSPCNACQVNKHIKPR